MSHDDIPAPTDWAEFEDFCCDLWRLRWKDEYARKHGRRGQKQRGVDVYGQTADGAWHAVQCKVKSQMLGARLTEAEIEKEVAEARTFEPALASLTLATTSPRDVEVETFVRQISDRQRAEGSFPVYCSSWQDILDACYDGAHPERLDLLKKHRGHWLDAGPTEVDLTHLPITGEHFLGRATELQRLDEAWADEPVNVLSIVAWGGVGKTALVKRWLDSVRRDGWRGAKRVYAWTFFSQGTREEGAASAEPFFAAVYRWLGEEIPTDPRGRGLRLSELLRGRRTLLYLDGVEPLQHPPGSAQEGRLRDPGLQAFLKSWAAAGNGLCVITTRERLTDLQDGGAEKVLLDELEPDSAVALLSALGAPGADRDLRAAAERFGHHALALTLLGNFLRRTDTDAARVSEIDFGKADERQGGHAFRVMYAYEKWLEPRELQVLRLVGLFDRAAPASAVSALRREPAIAGLTDLVAGLADEDWNWSVGALRENGLLAGADPNDRQALDAHPLVREYFGARLAHRLPEPWKEGNLRLYEHYRQVPEKDLPDTLDELLPLFAAVVHGCRAGRVQEALDVVFRRRIRRGNETYSLTRLGAFSTELAVLPAFFERTWDRPSAQLGEAARAWLLHEAGFILRAMGRLADAVVPMRAGLSLGIEQENWGNAAIAASNLSDLSLTLGKVADAVAAGEKSVGLADEGGDDFRRMANRTALADALHQAGRRDESAVAFRAAEAIQEERQPQYPRLYSLGGYRYCDLLLGGAESKDGAGLDGVAGAAAGRERRELQRYRKACEEVRAQAEQTLEWVTPKNWLLDVALDHLSLGRAHLGLELTAPAGTAVHRTAAGHLDQAVAGLRQASQEHQLPRGLLARATLRRLTGDPAGAAADLDEAEEIAGRGSMKLHLADVHLERTRLALFQKDDPAAARESYEKARRLVAETGYGRREREVQFLGEQLGLTQR
jgi:tetratricopeptide (TPR) repeat protein